MEKAEAYGLQAKQWLKAVHLAFSDTSSPTETGGTLRLFYEAHSVPEITLQHRVNQFYTVYFSSLQVCIKMWVPVKNLLAINIE